MAILSKKKSIDNIIAPLQKMHTALNDILDANDIELENIEGRKQQLETESARAARLTKQLNKLLNSEED